MVIGVDRPLIPAGRFDDWVESILDRETTLGMDVMERLLALGKRPSFKSDFLPLVDVFAALTLGPEPEEVPGQYPESGMVFEEAATEAYLFRPLLFLRMVLPSGTSRLL